MRRNFTEGKRRTIADEIRQVRHPSETNGLPTLDFVLV